MPEGVLGLAVHARAARGPDELATDHLSKRLDDLRLGAPAHGRDGPGPEHLPDHRGIGEDRLPIRRQRVEARGDQCCNGIRDRDDGTRPKRQASVGRDK